MSGAPAFPDHWNLCEPRPLADTRSSRLWTVRQADGMPAVVKVLKPAGSEELRGAHYLAWRRGIGAVRLLGLDGQAMLLEHAGDVRLSRAIDEQGDAAATEIASAVLARLLSPSHHPAPPEFVPLSTHFGGLFARKGTAGPHSSLYSEAAAIARELLATSVDIRPLHGDLHHDNIMLGARGWLAIDPHGVSGDPCFEAANLFYNPLARDDLCLDEARIAAMATCFSRHLSLDPRRILDFALAYGCLSAAWHAEDADGVAEARELAVARKIRAARRGF